MAKDGQSAQSIPLEPPDSEAVRQFAESAFRRLGWTMKKTERAGVYRLSGADDQPLDAEATAPFTFEKRVYDASTSDVELVTPGGRLMTYLIDQVRSFGSAAHARAADEPSLSDLSRRLFAAYQIDGGRCRLDGCTLEEQPLLHLTARVRIEASEPRESLVDVYLDRTGRTLSDAEVADLQLGDYGALVDCEPPPRLREEQIASLLSQGREVAEARGEAARRDVEAELAPQRVEEEAQLRGYYAKSKAAIEEKAENETDARRRNSLAEQLAQIEEVETDRLAAMQERYSATATTSIVSAVLVWRRFAEGALEVQIGEQTCRQGFAGWAVALEPPPIKCPVTGASSFHFAAVDDGRIVAAEQIEACGISGERFPREELARCELTGRLVLPRFLTTCAATGAEVLDDALVACSCCRQRVSPAALRSDGCLACRPLTSAQIDEEPTSLLLEQYPGLQSWGRWKSAIGHASHFFTAGRWLQSLRLVVSDDDLEVRYLAVRPSPLAPWRELKGSEAAKLLGR